MPAKIYEFKARSGGEPMSPFQRNGIVAYMAAYKKLKQKKADNYISIYHTNTKKECNEPSGNYVSDSKPACYTRRESDDPARNISIPKQPIKELIQNMIYKNKYFEKK